MGMREIRRGLKKNQKTNKTFCYKMIGLFEDLMFNMMTTLDKTVLYN